MDRRFAGNSIETHTEMSQHFAGFIFGCTKETMLECLQRRLFGSTFNCTSAQLIKSVRIGTPLFLFTYDTRVVRFRLLS